MHKDYNKFLNTKIFLIEQVVMNNLSEKDPNRLKRGMREILEITSGSYDFVKGKMNGSKSIA